MNRTLVAIACVSVLITGTARAQTQRQSTPQELEAEAKRQAQEQAASDRREREEAIRRDLESIVPLNVQVVVAKYQGEKRISSLPFTVTLANDRQRVGVRMGTKLPVPMMTAMGPDPTPVIYQDIGTNIDAQAYSLDSGRFSVTVTIEDSSVNAESQGPPAIRTYRSTSTLILRDGQTLQFTAASDKVTGEVIKADVTLKVVK